MTVPWIYCWLLVIYQALKWSKLDHGFTKTNPFIQGESKKRIPFVHVFFSYLNKISPQENYFTILLCPWEKKWVVKVFWAPIISWDISILLPIDVPKRYQNNHKTSSLLILNFFLQCKKFNINNFCLFVFNILKFLRSKMSGEMVSNISERMKKLIFISQRKFNQQKMYALSTFSMYFQNENIQ